VRRHQPDALIAVHQSGFRAMGIWSLADTLVEGEQYTSNWRGHIASQPELTDNDCYPTVLPLDRVRASYAGGLWGPRHVFLTQFWNDPRQKEKEYADEHGHPAPSYQRRMRHLSGLMRVHDTPLWGEMTPNEVWFRLVDGGYDETVEFIPYWAPEGRITWDAGGRERVVASGWFRPDGKLLVLVFNDTDEPARVRLTLHPDRFPVALPAFTKATDLSSPDPVLDEGETAPPSWEVRDHTVEVEVRARDYRLLRYETGL
jgi:hypothetical protein